MKNSDDITFEEFIQQHYSDSEYQLLNSLCSLLSEQPIDSISEEDIGATANFPEARIYRFFPEGKGEIVRCLLNALNRYLKQVLFAPLKVQYDDANKNLQAFVKILKRFQHCEAISLLLAVDTKLHAKQLQEYYFLWEMLLIGLLYQNNSRKPDLILVQQSVGIIHLTLLMQHLWKKPLDIEKILETLKSLWGELVVDIKYRLACSDVFSLQE